MIFDHAGTVHASAQMEHEQIYPSPGWVEHDPVEIWENTQRVIARALQKSAIPASSLSAIGVTNQRETTVVWDKRSGRPYANALVWQDMRTDQICRQLAKDGGLDRFRQRVGLPLATYFSGPKLMWLLDNVPGLRQDAEDGHALFGTIDSWLIWKLTDGQKHITDATNASRTMLMDLQTLAWDAQILEIMDIPRSMLPEIRPSSDPDFYGTTQINDQTITLCGDLGDQQAALFGQTCFLPGEVKNTYGTGCFLLLNTGKEIVHSDNGLLTTVAYQIANDEPVYALEGSVAIAGALVQWLRDNLGIIEQSSEIEVLANSVENNGGVYFVPAFSGLFAPHWRSDARGVIAGLTRFANKGHLARATLEAAAYQTRELLEAMRRDSGVDLLSLKVDGGMVDNELLMQFQADILGISVVRPEIRETTALGAAYAAGLAVGFWESQEQLNKNWHAQKTWQPRMPEEQKEALFAHWKKAVERSLGWVDEK